MRISSTFVISLRALRRNIMRSALTALGIIIGVAAVIAMVSIGNGAKNQIESQIASLGQNVIIIFPGSRTSGGARSGWGSSSSLTPEDATALVNEVPGVVAASPEIRDRSQVLANGSNWNTQIQGESPEYLDIRLWELNDGTMFTERDVKGFSKVAVIGQTVANQLFINEDPVGQTLRIRNIPFKILGVLKPKGFNFFGQDQDDVVIIPYTSHLKRVARRQRLNSIIVQAISPEAIPQIQQGITDLLQQRRKGREPDFTVRNQIELAEAATATSKTMTSLLGAIAGVSLIVGGIGIMNIMLVSVTERTREIGIRMSIGAHGSEILLQFLTEAVLISALGGTIGIALGISASEIMSRVNGWPTLISPTAIFVSFAVSAAVGVFFGYYPARKAAQLDPIEALRYE
ncbi:MAG: multidrug ABC transporter substrate-binding protein [Opitutaceae bacterium]|jgi:putative ABC transport system permease protein|nr:multidrug ABC transporter substrate-binding protein [Opitutaceae bacterium]|tara:strand:- start:526 stop:1734 length:1209 start_codon:yes stop_codon:yes gene_type:complete